jgi:hypothetical protein
VDLEEVRRIGESTHARMISDNAKENVGLDSWINTRITMNIFKRRCDPLDADECLGHSRHHVVCEYECVQVDTAGFSIGREVLAQDVVNAACRSVRTDGKHIKERARNFRLSPECEEVADGGRDCDVGAVINTHVLTVGHTERISEARRRRTRGKCCRFKVQ